MREREREKVRETERERKKVKERKRASGKIRRKCVRILCLRQGENERSSERQEGD